MNYKELEKGLKQYDSNFVMQKNSQAIHIKKYVSNRLVKVAHIPGGFQSELTIKFKYLDSYEANLIISFANQTHVEKFDINKYIGLKTDEIWYLIDLLNNTKHYTNTLTPNRVKSKIDKAMEKIE